MKTKKITIWFVVILLISFLIYSFWFEPRMIEIQDLWLTEVDSVAALKGKTAIHLSDLHFTHFGDREQKILKLVNEIQPDLIFLTGDYIAWKGDPEPALEFLSRLEAKYGVWAVMGDYDYSDSRKSCVFCHQAGSIKMTNRHKVTFLRDTVDFIKIGNAKIPIAGFDRASNDNYANGSRWDQFEENSRPRILLSHSPLNFDALRKKDRSLMLAGDTHGGQVPLPGLIWRLIGYKNNYLYNQGVFKQGNKMMIVSKGLGVSHFPFRFLKRPEIIAIHF